MLPAKEKKLFQTQKHRSHLNHDIPDTEEVISKMHHGKWWGDSWGKCCDCKEWSNKILIPIILYMDGISLDAYGRLTLTPLNTTLGIFNVKTKK